MINKQGKLFGKISIIDILAVVAIVVIIAGVYFKFIAPSETVVTDSHSLEYTMKFREIRIHSAEAFEKGGPVMDSKTREDMGEIVAVTYEPAKVIRELSDGRIAEIEVPEKYDVSVTMRVDGKQNETGYYTQKDNKVIGVGSRTTVDTKYVKCYGEIVDVKGVTE